MIEIKGKFNMAKVFATTLEKAAEEQIRSLCGQAFAAGSKIRIMPDVHAGAGCTIGTTMTIQDKIVPNLVGVDIGCGMFVCRLAEKDVDLQNLDKAVRALIPAGINIREAPHAYLEHIPLEKLKCLQALNLQRAKLSLGTLGGGNHFIEANRDEDGNLYVVIHSGSRCLGKQAAEYYQEAAWQNVSQNTGESAQDLISRLKAEGREAEIDDTLKTMNAQKEKKVPKSLAYLEGGWFDNYIHDMKIIQKYADYNRRAMMDELLGALGLNAAESFTTIHNYIDTEAMILRKGSVSAQAGEQLIIPINMRDGSLICIGKGNPDWNYSAPHGAGRLFSRIQAQKRFTVEQYRQAMGEIYTTSINEDTLDECPMAYKSMAEIVQNVTTTVEIAKVIKPIYNFKAGEADLSKWRQKK